MVGRGCDGDPVNARGVLDRAHGGAGIRVENVYANAMRNVDATGSAINGDVVPAFRAVDRKAIGDLVANDAGLTSNAAGKEE